MPHSAITVDFITKQVLKSLIKTTTSLNDIICWEL